MIRLNRRDGRSPLRQFFRSEELFLFLLPARIAEWESSTPTFALADRQEDISLSLTRMGRPSLRSMRITRSNLRIFRTGWRRPALPLPKSFCPRTAPVAFWFRLATLEIHGVIPTLRTAHGQMPPPGSDTSAVVDTRTSLEVRGMSRI